VSAFFFFVGLVTASARLRSKGGGVIAAGITNSIAGTAAGLPASMIKGRRFRRMMGYNVFISSCL
jgi:hypothetical protein